MSYAKLDLSEINTATASEVSKKLLINAHISHDNALHKENLHLALMLMQNEVSYIMTCNNNAEFDSELFNNIGDELKANIKVVLGQFKEVEEAINNDPSSINPIKDLVRDILKKGGK